MKRDRHLVLILLTAGCSSIYTSRCPPTSDNLGKCEKFAAHQSNESLYPYATPSVFRNIPDTEAVLKFMRLSPKDADAFARQPGNKSQFERVQKTLEQIQTIAALHNKTIYHFLAERGESDAIVNLYRDTHTLLKTGRFPQYDPRALDLYGISAAGYALNNLHPETYTHLTNLERLNGGLVGTQISFSAMDLDPTTAEALPEVLKEAALKTFHYYGLVDRSGDQKLSAEEHRKALISMYELFSNDVIYARNNVDIYRGKNEFKNFYEHVRDIEGKHDQILIKIMRVLPGGQIYLATHGRFQGRIRSSNKQIEAYFFDHFIYDPQQKTFIRRMSDIDSKI